MKPLSQGRMDGSTSNPPLHAADSSLFHVRCLRAIKESDLLLPLCFLIVFIGSKFSNRRNGSLAQIWPVLSFPLSPACSERQQSSISIIISLFPSESETTVEGSICASFFHCTPSLYERDFLGRQLSLGVPQLACYAILHVLFSRTAVSSLIWNPFEWNHMLEVQFRLATSYHVKEDGQPRTAPKIPHSQIAQTWQQKFLSPPSRE